MKADREKIELAMARACMNPKDLREAANMPEPSLKNVLSGRGVRPGTLGRVAKALGVDVTEIIAEEAQSWADPAQ